MEREYLISDDAAGKEVLNAMKLSTSALHWGDYNGRTLSNGSIFFLDTGEALFAVTARHVFEGYARAANKQPVVCQIDGVHFNPVSRLIAAGAEIDIATFRIAPKELERLRKNTIPWPPVIPEQGDGVLVCGLLGPSRFNPRPGLVDIGYSTSIMRVDSVSERTISMMRQPDEEMIDILGVGLPPLAQDIGGMSGGPVAAIQMTPSGLFFWSIAGVIAEGHQSFNIIQAMRADLINSDGTIRE